MALTDEQRGKRAAWLYHHRVTRFGPGIGGLNGLAEALRERSAYRAPETIKGWEASDTRSPIPPEVVPHLEEIFNDTIPRIGGSASTADLVSAIQRQTTAIEALVALIAKRDGITLPDLVRTPGEQALVAVLTSAVAHEAVELDRTREREAPPTPALPRPRPAGAR